MKYLIITEYGESYKADTLGEQDLEACDDWIRSIFDTEAMTEFDGEKWTELRTWGQPGEQQ